MDTKNDSSLSDVPTFKVARVGNDRKRKGGGFSFLRSGGARGSWSGATGGAGGVGGVGAGGMGAAAGAGFTFSKVMLICLVSVGGLGAVGLGRMIGNARQEVKKPKAFSMAREPIKLEGDTANLPTTPNTIPNSLGYLSGSMDGLTPEERAKKAAEAEAQRLADEEAARKAEEEQTAANPAVDPNALLASAQADGAAGGKGSAFGKKFGSLSSSLGGGSSLSGGAGLSGGVNRQFGSGGGMAIKKDAAGKLSAMKSAARPSYSKAGGARLASSKTKGFARKQLANANAYSRRGAAAGQGETSSSDAATAFDNNPGAGNVISGPGIGNGAGSSSGADSTPNSVDNGGPTGGDPTVDCGPDRYQDQYGNCQNINTNSGSDANKALTMMANVVMGLLLVIGVISAFAAIARDSVYLAAAYPMLASIVGVLGVVVTLLGAAMMGMGDYVTGGLATLIGGYVSYMSYISPEGLTVGQGMVAGLGGAALTMAGKMLGDDKDKAPEAAQQ
ncbi:MAG: hypothetical protein Q8T11_11215 [Elusimicrobiota bacterium]|nr:hypothetical protein [Elusimicrobiota bacterium]